MTIARALVTDPTLIATDESTDDLDKISAEEIMELLARLNHELGKAIIDSHPGPAIVTQDPRTAARASRVLYLDKGTLLTA